MHLILWMLLVLPSLCFTFDYKTQTFSDYVSVRPGANMFYWFYYAAELTLIKPETLEYDYVTVPNPERKPIIMWLQGGPGGSGSGYGNFMEIGPQDVQLRTRNSSWIRHANLLFVDNPVGTGYSYVNSKDLLAKNNQEIATDLVTMLKSFYERNLIFESSPFYIFSESYGGKMAVSTALALDNAIRRGEIRCNFKGIALGDSWISPVDIVATYPQYLQSFSLIDDEGFKNLSQICAQIEQAIQNNDSSRAFHLYGSLQKSIENSTDHVDFYNVLRFKDNTDLAMDKLQHKEQINSFFPQADDSIDETASLEQIMNEEIHQILCIPKNVIWSLESFDVYKALNGDFFKSVIHEVETILNNHANLSVTIYNGQLDLVVDALGTQAWVNKLAFSGKARYVAAPRKLFKDYASHEMYGFIKSYNKLTMYWLLNSGHMVPKDVPDAAFEMVQRILGA